MKKASALVVTTLVALAAGACGTGGTSSGTPPLRMDSAP